MEDRAQKQQRQKRGELRTNEEFVFVKNDSSASDKPILASKGKDLQNIRRRWPIKPFIPPIRRSNRDFFPERFQAMEASFFRASTLFLSHSAFLGKPHQKPRPYLRNKASFSKICAVGNGSHDRDFGGRLVDEDMVELRKRIRDIKRRDDDEEQPPADWMKWEKQYHKHYGSDVCQLIGFLQIALMNTRPSTALGLLALVGLSVPTSVGMIMINLIGAAKGIFPGA